MIQQDFYDAADKWLNIFLTGIGWSGKSYAIEQWKKANYKKKKIITVAPTGVAAINVWGVTIHRAFKLPFGNIYYNVTKQKIDWKKVDVLIIDEISMVWVHMMEQIDRTLRTKVDMEKPFWGLQVIVVGDMAQLPPIIVWDKDVKTLVDKFGWIEFHNSDWYKEGNFTDIMLTENKRSSDDKLNNALNKVREWKFTLMDFQTKPYSAFFSNRATHIMASNNEVDNFNLHKLTTLKWKSHLYKGEVTWNFNMKNVLTPENLELKEWATVMITKNLECWLVNWDLWEVSECHDSYIDFYSYRKDEHFMIWETTWEEKNYDETGNEEIVWTFTQVPVKLWWAITAHKSQWLTMDRVVFHYKSYLDIKLIYVALSRATTWDNLYIHL